MQPRFDRRDGRAESLAQFITACALNIGLQDDFFALRVEPIETCRQPGNILTEFEGCERMGYFGGDIEGLRCILDRDVPAATHFIEGAIARNRCHPGDGRGPSGIKIASALPDFHENLLHNLICQIPASQDTQDDSVKFRARGLIEGFKRALILDGDAREQD